MAGFSFKKLFRPHATTSKPRHVQKLKAPLDPHSLALSRSLSTVTPGNTRRLVSISGRSASATNSRLPPELILLIFSQASTSTLPLIACLCKATRAWVEERLYDHPELSSARSINLIIRTLRRSPRLAGLVRGVTMDGNDGRGGKRTVTGRLSQILEVCPRLEQIEITQAVVFSLTDFANATHLTHLTLTSSILSDRTTTSRYHPFFTTLPALTRLTLDHTAFDLPTARHFLCPTTMPVLKELDLDSLTLIDDPEHHREMGPYEPVLLAERLEYLRVGDSTSLAPPASSSTSSTSFLSLCPNLAGLSLPLSAVAEVVLDSLPHRLAFLEIRSPPSKTSTALSGDIEEEPLDEETTLAHLQAALALASSFLALSSSATNRAASSHPHSGANSPSYGLSRSPSSANFLGTSPGNLSALFEQSSIGVGGKEEAVGVEKLDVPLGALQALRLPLEWSAWEMALHHSATPSWSRSGSRNDLRPSLSRSHTASSIGAAGRARGFSLSSVASASGGRWGGDEAASGGGEMGWAMSRIGRVGREREVDIGFAERSSGNWGLVRRDLGL